MRKILQSSKGRGVKVYSILGSVLFLIQSSWCALWPLLPPFHTHSAGLLVRPTDDQVPPNYYLAHRHQPVLQRDGSLIWYNFYQDEPYREVLSGERGNQEVFQTFPLLTTERGEYGKRVVGAFFFLIPSRYIFSPATGSMRIKAVDNLLPAPGYVFPIDHPPKNYAFHLATV